MMTHLDVWTLSVWDIGNPISSILGLVDNTRAHLVSINIFFYHYWCDLTKEEWLPMSSYDNALINSSSVTCTTKDGTNSCPWSPSILYSTFISRHQVSAVVIISMTNVLFLFLFFCLANTPIPLDYVDALSKPDYLSNKDCIASATQCSFAYWHLIFFLHMLHKCYVSSTIKCTQRNRLSPPICCPMPWSSTAILPSSLSPNMFMSQCTPPRWKQHMSWRCQHPQIDSKMVGTNAFIHSHFPL